MAEVKALKLVVDECSLALYGDGVKTSKEFETVPGIMERLGLVQYMLSDNTLGVTKSQQTNTSIAEEEYKAFRTKLDGMVVRLTALEKELEKVPVPYIKGKDQNWKKD